MFLRARWLLRDPYRILRLPTTATIEEVRARFRELAHQYHPDHFQGTDDRFKEINTAYQEILALSQRRQQDGSTSRKTDTGHNEDDFDLRGADWRGPRGGVHSGPRTSPPEMNWDEVIAHYTPERQTVLELFFVGLCLLLFGLYKWRESQDVNLHSSFGGRGSASKSRRAEPDDDDDEEEENWDRFLRRTMFKRHQMAAEQAAKTSSVSSWR